MTKASDNQFPSILAVNTSNASISNASPWNAQRLFFDADGTLKRKDSSGTVTAVEGGGTITVGAVSSVDTISVASNFAVSDQGGGEARIDAFFGGGGASAIDDLSDVDTDKSKTPADGDVLTYDGTHWNAEAASGGGITSGTDQGAAGSAGTLYFRTDLGLLIYDDGTRWLTVNEYSLTPAQFGSSGSTSSIFAWMGLPADVDVYLTRWDSMGRINTTGQWTIGLFLEDFEGDETTVDTYVVTNAAQSTNWYTFSEAIGTVVASSAGNSANTVNHLQVKLTEDSGSSELVGGVTVYYRRIIADPA